MLDLTVLPSTTALLDFPSNVFQSDNVSTELQQGPMGTYVGELHELWTFPSDHLPIGLTLNYYHILSWNVLSSDYMEWVIEKNSQGLSRSLIADEHVYLDASKLTIRDKHVVQLILEAIHHPNHPRNILALQECHPAFLNELKANLLEGYELVGHGENILIVNTKVFEVVEDAEIYNVFSCQPCRSIQQTMLKDRVSNQFLKIINVHLPGDPLQPSPFELAQYLALHFDPSTTTIAMGDMNFNELEMQEGLDKIFKTSESPFSLYTPYCTNISVFEYKSKAIDHFIVYNTNNSVVTLDKPDAIMPGVEKMLSLLSKKQS